jgi:ABC-type glycerol-3-phosphate transport system substrate-binding protein
MAADLDATDPKIWPKTWKDLFALAKKVERRDASGKLTRLGFNRVWGNDGF